LAVCHYTNRADKSTPACLRQFWPRLVFQSRRLGIRFVTATL
jgi:hypothetical protein